MNKFTDVVQLVGPHGVCNVEVTLAFSIHPNKFSPGMTLIAHQQLKDAVQQIVSKAAKTK